MSFLAELKRRNVIRVGVAYAVATWLLLQVVGVVGPILDLPGWVPKLVLLLLAIGLVPVLIFAWVFELTPEGLKREVEVDRGASITHETARKLDYVTIGLLIAVAALIGIDRFLPREIESKPETVSAAGTGSTAAPEARAAPPAKSIAVLPFVNMSEDASNEYFSDGISEEILNALARVTDLKVAGRTSSFAFKGKNQDLRLIGEALGVSHILEGSVRKAANRVRITAQLIKVDDGFHVWSENYDRELNDVFAIQDEISAAILEQLRAHLSGEEPYRAARTDTRAYDLYLLAGQRIYERNQASLELAADLLRQAIAIDPAYAPAYAQLGTATLLLADVNYGTIPQGTALADAKVHLEKALELDPANAEALAGMGLHHLVAGDYVGGMPWLERAVAVNPNLANANLWLSGSLASQGESRRAREILETNFARDPLHRPNFDNLVQVLALSGQVDEARQHALAIKPFVGTDPIHMGSVGKVELIAGNWAQASRLLAQSLDAQPGNFVDRLWFSSALFATAQYGELEKSGAEPWVALGLSRQGRTEEALMLAERSVDSIADPSFLLQVLAEDGRFGEALSYVDSRWPTLEAFERASSPRDGFGALGLILVAQANARLDREAAFFDALRRAEAAIDWQTGQGADNFIIRVSAAAVASLAGDREGALALLEKAVSAGALPRLEMEGPNSLFEALQGDARYEAILQRIRERRNAERAALGLDPLPV